MLSFNLLLLGYWHAISLLCYSFLYMASKESDIHEMQCRNKSGPVMPIFLHNKVQTVKIWQKNF